MSPNQVFPLESGPRNPIAQRVLDNPDLTFDVDATGIVIAVKDELLVRKSVREATPELHQELSKIARRCGTLASIPQAPRAPEAERSAAQPEPCMYQPDENGAAGDIEIWRLKDDTADSIDQSRRLRLLAADEPLETNKGRPLLLPAVSPNHVAILSAKC